MVLFAYLLGSISSAILVCKIGGFPDPRSQGSGNPGATNVLRVANKTSAAIVLLCDVLKGTIPVWGAYFLELDPLVLGVIAVSACLGHMYPVFFKFQGGKAVATAWGALAPISWIYGLALITVWLTTAKLTRYSSLAAIVTVSVAPVLVYFIKSQYTVAVFMLSCLIIWRHKDNIKRLLNGTEPKLGDKKPTKV